MAQSTEKETSQEKATLASGCFWCTEAVFQRLKGVKSVVPGYTGGSQPNPSYQEVSSGSTGHTEAIQVTFDPQTISYQTLLDVFFSTHDPTTLNRQGSDIGSQYRSAIFYHSEEQKMAARQTIQQLQDSGKYQQPIVTEVAPFSVLYPAEDYHRDFYLNNPDHPYCQAVIDPKITKLLDKHMSLIRES